MPAAAVYLLPGFGQATAQAITQRDGGSSRPAAHAHLGIQEGKSMPSIRSTTTLLMYSASGFCRLSLQQCSHQTGGERQEPTYPIGLQLATGSRLTPQDYSDTSRANPPVLISPRDQPQFVHLGEKVFDEQLQRAGDAAGLVVSDPPGSNA